MNKRAKTTNELTKQDFFKVLKQVARKTKLLHGPMLDQIKILLS